MNSTDTDSNVRFFCYNTIIYVYTLTHGEIVLYVYKELHVWSSVEKGRWLLTVLTDAIPDTGNSCPGKYRI